MFIQVYRKTIAQGLVKKKMFGVNFLWFGVKF